MGRQVVGTREGQSARQGPHISGRKAAALSWVVAEANLESQENHSKVDWSMIPAALLGKIKAGRG